MKKEDIQNLIKNLIEKTGITVIAINIAEDGPHSTWFKVEVKEPHFFIGNDGEALYALNHLVRRIIEDKNLTSFESEGSQSLNGPNPLRGRETEVSIMIDINGFQKKRVENVRAVAHMMGERARYFKSSIEVDPMPAFERRIVHEFFSNTVDLKTESVGMGVSRRVVIKYVGGM